MKVIKQNLIWGVLLLVSPLFVTSCDDLIGELDNPTPVTPSGEDSNAPTVTSITLNENIVRLSLFEGQVDNATLTATTDLAGAAVTWSSSDDSKVEVDAAGKVTAKTAGHATITAKAGDKTATCEVYVYHKIVDIESETGPTLVVGGGNNHWLIRGTKTEKDISIKLKQYATVTLQDVKINCTAGAAIACDAGNTIILADDSENKMTSGNDYAGIAAYHVAGETLTIKGETAGTGKLSAFGGNNAAGIGSSVDKIFCNIIIEGGDITAKGGINAAGIGSGEIKSGIGTRECGKITISGGTVKAYGGNDAAGIGTGKNTGAETLKCGDITISGGTVEATGGINGAGIGTGCVFGNRTSRCGNITISGGTVKAWGDSKAAGIGTGKIDGSGTQQCGNITIETGVTNVTAIGGSQSPNKIGKGKENSGGHQFCGNITFGTAQVYDGSAWSPNPMVAGTYGGLNLVFSKLLLDDDTWTLTPAL